MADGGGDRPPTQAALRSWADQRWPGQGWATSRLTHGAFHPVLLGDDRVLRVAVGPGHEERARWELVSHTLVAAVALPWPVPRLLVPAVVAGPTWSALLLERLPGAVAPDLAWGSRTATVFGRLLRSLARTDAALVAGLPPHRAWCGGTGWRGVVEEDLAPLLPRSAATAATRAADAALALEGRVQPVLCHGDLGPHNVLWRDGRPTGVVDLDHACVADPAVDVAGLVAFFGAGAVAEVVDADVLDRAITFRAVLGLEVAAAAHLLGDVALRDHALANFTRGSANGELRIAPSRR
jgi:aminoglycoside phosphotransferase (APT) family kinase protein